MLTSIRLTSSAAAAARRNVRWLHHRICDTFAAERILWAQPSPTGVIVRSDGLVANADLSWMGSCGILQEGALRDGPATISIIACPTIARRNPDRKSRGARTPLTDPSDKNAWLTRRLSSAIAVEEIVCEPLGAVFAHKGDTVATIKRTRFTASGNVTSVNHLRDIITHGIGPGKAYGCGMVVVAP